MIPPALSNTLASEATEQGDAEVGYVTAQNATNLADEQGRTLVEAPATAGEAGAGRDYAIASQTNLKNLTAGLGAAAVSLSQAMRPINVERTEEVAAAEGTLHAASAARVATRMADWAALGATAGLPSSEERQFDAAQAAALSQWTTAMQPAFTAFAGAMALGEENETVALVTALAAAEDARAAADLAYTTAVEPLYYQQQVDSGAAWRAFAEAEAARVGTLNLAGANVYKPLDIAYATAAKGQAIGHATAEKAYWLGFYDAGEPLNPSVLSGTRDVAKADSDVAQVDALGIADEAWTTGYVAADRVYRTDRATGVKNWQTAQAAIDRDLAIATAPLEETLTLAYLAAQTAYWTAEVAAASTRRTAEATSLADWRDDDHAGKTAAAAGLDTAMSLPWTEYQADKAAALENWWTTDERANFLALAAATNTAETAYQTTVNTAYTAWATATAGAEKTFAIADAGNQYDWIVADLAAEAAYEQALALADEAWQVEHADAKRAFDLAKKTNWRNFVEDANLTARQTADALAAGIQAGENQENDQTYTIDEAEAAGIRKLAKATSWRDYVADFNTAVVPYVASTAGADETYAVAEATAHATRAIAIADAMKDRDLESADSLAAALDALALTSTTPWADYDAALADADDTFTAAVAPALAANLTAHANAELAFTTSQAAAVESLDNALTTASTTHRLSLANADRDRAITEVLAENNAAQTVPINNLASMTGRAVASATGSAPAAQGDQPATSPDGRPNTPPKVYGPELPTSPKAVETPASGSFDPLSRLPHPIPPATSDPPESPYDIFARPLLPGLAGYTIDPDGSINNPTWPFLKQFLVGNTPVVLADTEDDADVVTIIIIIDDDDLGSAASLDWTATDIEREAQRRATQGHQGVWTAELEREKQRLIGVIKTEIAIQKQANAEAKEKADYAEMLNLTMMLNGLSREEAEQFLTIYIKGLAFIRRNPSLGKEFGVFGRAQEAFFSTQLTDDEIAVARQEALAHLLPYLETEFAVLNGSIQVGEGWTHYDPFRRRYNVLMQDYENVFAYKGMDVLFVGEFSHGVAKRNLGKWANDWHDAFRRAVLGESRLTQVLQDLSDPNNPENIHAWIVPFGGFVGVSPSGQRLPRPQLEVRTRETHVTIVGSAQRVAPGTALPTLPAGYHYRNVGGRIYVVRNPGQSANLPPLHLENGRLVFGHSPSVIRDLATRAAFLRQLAESPNIPSNIRQWLQRGEVPPGFQVHHRRALFDGGTDTIDNMVLQGKDIHIIIHRYYRPGGQIPSIRPPGSANPY